MAVFQNNRHYRGGYMWVRSCLRSKTGFNTIGSLPRRNLTAESTTCQKCDKAWPNYAMGPVQFACSEGLLSHALVFGAYCDIVVYLITFLPSSSLLFLFSCSCAASSHYHALQLDQQCASRSPHSNRRQCRIHDRLLGLCGAQFSMYK